MNALKRLVWWPTAGVEYLAKVTGLWRLDVALWNREAAKLEKLAAECAAAGVASASVLQLQRRAALLRRSAIERTAWATSTAPTA